MKKVGWFAVWFWVSVVAAVFAWMLTVGVLVYRIAETQEAVLKETRIHTLYIRGALPETADHDGCGK